MVVAQEFGEASRRVGGAPALQFGQFGHQDGAAAVADAGHVHAAVQHLVTMATRLAVRTSRVNY